MGMSREREKQPKGERAQEAHLMAGIWQQVTRWWKESKRGATGGLVDNVISGAAPSEEARGPGARVEVRCREKAGNKDEKVLLSLVTKEEVSVELEGL